MKLFRSKVWSAVDIGCLKWSCIFSGMIIGAFSHEFTRQHVWLFAIAVILLAIKPTLSYFGSGRKTRIALKDLNGAPPNSGRPTEWEY